MGRRRKPLGGKPRGGKFPQVNFTQRDNSDSGPVVTAKTVDADYYVELGHEDHPKRIYATFIPLTQLPAPHIVEDGNPNARPYPWGRLMEARELPPIKLIRWGTGALEIIDGNHRLALWKNQGFEFIPAWVIDLG